MRESLSISTALPSARSPKNEKLQAFWSRKTADQQLQLMNNRVNQLDKIKRKTEKEVEGLRMEILREEELKRQRDMGVEKKRRFSQDNFEFLMKKKEKNRQDRLGIKTNIRDFKEKLLKQRQQIVNEKRENAIKWQEEIQENKNKDLESKAKKYKKLKNGYVRSLRDRCLTQRHSVSLVKSQYEESIENEKRIENDAIKKVEQLETTENSLIDDLSKTLELQQSLQATLRRLRTLSS